MNYILTKTGEQFKPEGIAGENIHTDEQASKTLFYRSYITGTQGAHYELLRDKTNTDEDANKAKSFLRRNFDVISIHILNEKA